MLVASPENSMNTLTKKKPFKTTSVSITSDLQDDYNLLRKFLSDNNLSIGEYLVKSFVLNYKEQYINNHS